METKPTAFHSLDEWVSESQISAAATIYSLTAPDGVAPTAQPEGEDIDMEVSPEIKKPDKSETKIQTESTVELNSTKIDRNLCEDEFPPPPPDFNDFSIEDASEQDFSMEVIDIEWTDNDVSNQFHYPDKSQKLHNYDFNSESDNTTDAIYTSDGIIENVSTHLTAKERTSKDSECQVTSVPFADDSDEDAEADTENMNAVECDVSESGAFVPVVDDPKQQGELSTHCEMPSERDTLSSTFSTSDYQEIIILNESDKDERVCLNSMCNLDSKCDVSESNASTLQSDLSLHNAVPILCGIQSCQKYSEADGENDDNIEPNALLDELPNTHSTVFSSLLANDNNHILQNSEYENSVSELWLSSHQQGELGSTNELPPVTDIQSGLEHCDDVFDFEGRESEDTIELIALSDEHSEANLSEPSAAFANKSKGEEAYANILHNLHYKGGNTSESSGSALAVEAVSEQQEGLSPQCELLSLSDVQVSLENIGDGFNAEAGESEDAIKPIALPDEITDLTVSESSNYDEHILCPIFTKESYEDKEAYHNTLHISDDMFDILESTASASTVLNVSEQQEELSLQHELAPLGVNQEATQQVLSQASPPLSTVSIEPANHTAWSEGSRVVIAEGREGHGAVEGERKPISADERQFTGSKTVGPITGVLKSLSQEQKSEKLRPVSFRHRTMESDSCDESDSGVSADFSPGSTLESSSSSSVHKETPIEREIRRAIEREHSLRRSRGLPNPPTSLEYVEIPLRKAVPYQPLPPTKADKCQGKDRQFAGKKMQQDIYEEAKREQDLVKLGKIPGFYDKGTVRQLKEKKTIFEAFQKPNDLYSVKSKSISSSNYISFSENDSLCHKVKGTGSDTKKDMTLKTPKDFPEAKSCQIIIIENNINLPTIQPNSNIGGAITVVDSSKDKTGKDLDEKELLNTPKENPFFKLRSSTSVVKVEQDIREAQEREKELCKQRMYLYGSRAERGGGRPTGTEEHSSILSSMKALPVQDLPDSSQTKVTTTTATSAAHHSSGRLGVWPPAAPEKNHQTEVHHGPRTPRQKNPLVQRWESGLINAQED